MLHLPLISCGLVLYLYSRCKKCYDFMNNLKHSETGAWLTGVEIVLDGGALLHLDGQLLSGL